MMRIHGNIAVRSKISNQTQPRIAMTPTDIRDRCMRAVRA